MSKLPDRCFCFDFAWLVTFNLVCCKYPKNNEFRTKKFLNQGLLYGISSFCIFSKKNSFLHGKISCFCIFQKKLSAVHAKLAQFLFGSRSNMPFMVLYSLTAIVGATMNLGLMWSIAETFNGLMVIPNLIAVFLLSGVVVKMTKEYFAKENG